VEKLKGFGEILGQALQESHFREHHSEGVINPKRKGKATDSQDENYQITPGGETGQQSLKNALG